MKTFRNQKKKIIDGTDTKDIEKIQAIKIPNKYKLTPLNNSLIFPKSLFFKKNMNDIKLYDVDFISKSSKKLIEYNKNKNSGFKNEGILALFITGLIIGFGINSFFVFHRKNNFKYYYITNNFDNFNNYNMII
uniref:Uncharacterized protein n=1 Tax=viral metagenome TaxID=1070528 RepID=A0A6C0KXK6_9ZZZZ